MFEAIIGHKKPCTALALMVKNNTLPHALLFVGPDHVGKTTVAMALARHFGGEKPNIDFVHVKRLRDKKTNKRKSTISVAQIRELCATLAMSAMADQTKVVFIEEADRLSTASANALLKTLEEPRGKTVIILRAPHVQALPATIVSRCQVFSFSLVEDARVSKEAHGRPGIAWRLAHDAEYAEAFLTRQALARDLIASAIPERLATLGAYVSTAQDKRLAAARLLEATELILHEHGRMQDLVRLLDVRKALRANVNPQLALEYLFLNV